jgi:hypothetical protein
MCIIVVQHSIITRVATHRNPIQMCGLAKSGVCALSGEIMKFRNQPMKTIQSTVPLLAAMSVAFSATAATFTDATGDNYGGPEVDIASVAVNNDANNITFQINMNTAADLGANHFANYEVGIQVNGGVGGQTAINGTFGTGNPAAGNPYGNAVGISTGENFFIGSFLTSPGNFSGGAQLFSYSSTTGWTQVGATAPITEVTTGTPSTAFTFPLAALGLTPGSSFKFDVYTSFGSPQGAYDALDNASLPPGAAPFSGGTYDSATAEGSVLPTYVVPEPTTIALAVLGGGLLVVSRARRRKS